MQNERRLTDRITACTGDITSFDGDAIVNAANSGLLGGGGVDGAIHHAGGKAILDECRKIRETDWPSGLPAGKAVITGGGRLAARYVIHTVGPVWDGGNAGEDADLASCYASSLSIAAGLKLGSVAFPAISTGIYGFPKARAARIAFDTVCRELEKTAFPETVLFVFFSESDEKIFLDSLDINGHIG